MPATAHAAYGDSCAFNPTNIFGTEGPDSIVGGGETVDVIFAFGGDDYIAGGTHAEDWLCGGRGDDLIKGGHETVARFDDAFGDGIFGRQGNDTIYAGAGLDYVWGGGGKDKITGGQGADGIEGGVAQTTSVVAPTPTRSTAARATT